MLIALFEEFHLHMQSEKCFNDPVVDQLSKRLRDKNTIVHRARPGMNFSEERQFVLEVGLSCLVVPTEKFQADEYYAGDKSHANRCPILGREMRLKMADRFAILSQHELLLFIRDVIFSSWTVAMKDLPLVNRA